MYTRYNINKQVHLLALRKPRQGGLTGSLFHFNHKPLWDLQTLLTVKNITQFEPSDWNSQFKPQRVMIHQRQAKLVPSWRCTKELYVEPQGLQTPVVEFHRPAPTHLEIWHYTKKFISFTYPMEPSLSVNLCCFV